MKIVFATGNKNKMKEIRKILGGLGMEIQSMAEAGVEGDVEENGSSFAENSMIKARAVAEELKAKGDLDSIVLADDSGLEVDYRHVLFHTVKDKVFYQIPFFSTIFIFFDFSHF